MWSHEVSARWLSRRRRRLMRARVPLAAASVRACWAARASDVRVTSARGVKSSPLAGAAPRSTADHADYAPTSTQSALSDEALRHSATPEFECDFDLPLMLEPTRASARPSLTNVAAAPPLPPIFTASVVWNDDDEDEANDESKRAAVNGRSDLRAAIITCRRLRILRPARRDRALRRLLERTAQRRRTGD